MAIGASIYKINVNLNNFNTHQYDEYNLTVAKHPSENEDRMMYRILAFLHNAHEDLEFTKGISTKDEPDIWQKGLSGEVIHWIELGQPDEKRIRQACGRAQKVSIYTYHPTTSLDWFEKVKHKIDFNKVQIYHFVVTDDEPIDKFVERGMRLSLSIEDNRMGLTNEDDGVMLEINQLTRN